MAFVVVPQADPAKLARTRELIVEAVPDCLVYGYERLTEDLDLVAPSDRHVVAAARCAHAQVIVTFNQRHFPDHALERFGIETKHPDEFVMDSVDLAPGQVVASLNQMAATYRNPPLGVDEILNSLSRLGLPQSVSQLRRLVGP